MLETGILGRKNTQWSKNRFNPTKQHFWTVPPVINDFLQHSSFYDGRMRKLLFDAIPIPILFNKNLEIYIKISNNDCFRNPNLCRIHCSSYLNLKKSTLLCNIMVLKIHMLTQYLFYMEQYVSFRDKMIDRKNHRIHRSDKPCYIELFSRLIFALSFHRQWRIIITEV